MNDYVFTELGINEEFVRNPIIVTESHSNPEYCRMNMLEHYFECYGVPSVLLGTESLFAYFNHCKGDMKKYNENTKLILHLGANSCHITPIVKGKIHNDKICRLNVGGNNGFECFKQNIWLKYPLLKQKMQFPMLEVKS